MLNWLKKSKKDNDCCNVKIEEVKKEKQSCCNVKIEEVVEIEDNNASKVDAASSSWCSSKTEYKEIASSYEFFYLPKRSSGYNISLDLLYLEEQ